MIDDRTSVRLEEIVDWLEPYLSAGRIGEDLRLLVASLNRPVRRLGLALEPWPEIGTWVRDNRLDALLLHRPWTFSPTSIPRNTAVLACHLAFDRMLTVGYNRRLADLLNMDDVQTLGEKDGFPLGMTARVEPVSVRQLAHVFNQVFGGLEADINLSDRLIDRVAVVGAMNDELVRSAHERGVGLYVTGQLREPGRRAVEQTGMAAIAIGHRRAELWGMRALCGLLRERFAGLEVMGA